MALRLSYHFGSISLQGPLALGSRHMSRAVPLWAQVFVHSSSSKKLFMLPLQPPYTNSSHFSVSLSNPHLKLCEKFIFRFMTNLTLNYDPQRVTRRGQLDL
jgi:hypothetical protein